MTTRTAVFSGIIAGLICVLFVKAEIANDCDTFSKFVVLGKTYECQRVEE